MNEILKKRIGIIGGGQLGKMMILEAKKMGFYVTILDPTLHCPAHSISDEHIVAAFDDEAAIKKLAQKSDVITYEFEHIGVEALKKLDSEGYIIYPTPLSLEIIQNKYEQKSKLQQGHIPIPDFVKVNNIEDIHNISTKWGYPLVLKTCTGGYDGKGNAVIETVEETEEKYELLGAGKIPLMIEKYISFTKEISVLACRGVDGTITVYPVGENIHCNSILDETIVPANISHRLTKEAMKLSEQVMEVFAGVGMFCVEMFVTEDERLLINEVAPRPHNSGHYTIEGCATSQFEQHIRAIIGLPLGSVELLKPTVMKNIIGEENADGIAYYEGLEEAMTIPEVKIHIYGKETVKPSRKMGHLTVRGNTVEEAIEKARLAKAKLKCISIGGEK